MNKFNGMKVIIYETTRNVMKVHPKPSLIKENKYLLW